MWLGQDSVFEHSANSMQLSDFSLTAEGLRLTAIKRRGVEQRQLVGLITQRSAVRVRPPQPRISYETASEDVHRRSFVFVMQTFCKHSQEISSYYLCWESFQVQHRTPLELLLPSLATYENKCPVLFARMLVRVSPKQPSMWLGEEGYSHGCALSPVV